MSGGRDQATLHTAHGSHCLRLSIAANFTARLRGLIAAAPLAIGEGMLITRCNAVHTGFMRHSLDLVFLDRAGRVLRCMPQVAPWRMRIAPRAAHTLEMACGSIAHYRIAPGDRLQHPSLAPLPAARAAERGAAMVEFVIVAPALTMLGLGLLQFCLLYFAKSQIDHAAFLAARAGSMHNATAASISGAYLRGLAPLYGGGANAAEIDASRQRAAADMQGNFRIELMNPTRASFDDFNDPALQAGLHTGARVIPNQGLAFRDPAQIGKASKQNLFDANLLKLRIIHGYEPKVPLMRLLLQQAMQAQDQAAEAAQPGSVDKFSAKLHADGRIAVVSEITLHMQSDAIEWSDPVWTSTPGADASPQPPADKPGAPPPEEPGDATNPAKPQEPAPAGGAPDNSGCGAWGCLSCRPDLPLTQEYPLAADVLFDFDQATLRTDGLTDLDDLIDEVKAAQADGQGIASVRISGYTDQLGSDALNQKLSLARAEAVRDYIASKGFPDVPIAVRGMGAAEPKVALDSCAGQGQEQIACLAPNRRVVIEITRSDKPQ
jgi:outer membrane protein OmpA-like peptidoglycan-associated protein/uncharacterized membrane protein (UPF0127 family)